MANYYYATVTAYTDDTQQNTWGSFSSTAIPNSSVTTYNNYAVWFAVQVWQTQNSNHTGGITLGGDHAVVRIAAPSGTSSQIKMGTVGQYPIHLFAASVQRKSASGNVSVTPTFTILQNIETGTDTPVTFIKWANATNTAFTVSFTTKVTDPTFPYDLIYINAKCSSTNIITSSRFWDKNLNKWSVITANSVTGIRVYYLFSKDGSTWTTPVFTKPITNPPTADSLFATAAERGKSNAAQDAAFLNSKKGGTGVGIIDGSGPSVDSNFQEASGTDRYNPPPHSNARSISYGERISKGNGGYTNTSFKDIARKLATADRLRIIQDVNGAKALNKNGPGGKQPTGTNNLWGFRAMYNPTNYSYTTAANNSVDWTFGSKDPAVLLAGNQNLSLELYLNRIPDMEYLRNNGRESDLPRYGRTLTDVEAKGLLNRGTEYDIEFLYRVLNGDPTAKSLLLDGTNYSGLTSDYGYTTATPCWLHLNDNMRYFGSVASLTVNHAIFDSNMVPMFSTVNITFSRYPALWNVGGDKRSAVVDALKSQTGGTTTTTPPAGG